MGGGYCNMQEQTQHKNSNPRREHHVSGVITKHAKKIYNTKETVFQRNVNDAYSLWLLPMPARQDSQFLLLQSYASPVQRQMALHLSSAEHPAA